MVRSGPRHHWSGARLSDGTTKAVLECFRCSEDRRKLMAVRIVAAGGTLGTTLLCGECILALVPLDPDPLDSTSIA